MTQPSHGSLDVGDTVTVIVDDATQQVFTDEWVTYTPDPGYAGVDSFTFVALDESRPRYPINPVVAKVTLDVSDLDGNYYATFDNNYLRVSNETAVVSLPPVTVRVVDLPDSHNGTDSLTFRIAFSESVNVRAEYGSGMVEVSGGTVTNVQNLNRRTEECGCRTRAT